MTEKSTQKVNQPPSKSSSQPQGGSKPRPSGSSQPGSRPPSGAPSGGSASFSNRPPRPRPAGSRQPHRPQGPRPGSPSSSRPPQAKPPRPPREEAPSRPIEIEVPSSITVRDLAEMMQRSPIDVIKVLMNYGIMAPITQSIDYDTAAIIAEDLGIATRRKEEPRPAADAVAEEKQTKTLRQRLLELTPEDRLAIRPPVVTVLGHVDHGKTTLLDAIRKTDVVSGESGGITQHIGAYQIEYGGRKVTFLDTPGHQAFTAMRARGAQVTDIAVLVVAADDGVMPQTKEAIAHARAAGVPIVVALNKVDKVNANPDRVKQELADQQLVVEDWGGDVIMVPVSAKLGKGIDDLLENLLILADVEGFKADAGGDAIGTVIESRMDKSRGATATLLVQKGTLRVGDNVVTGSTHGRVRAMFDDKGQPVTEAGPSTPVAIIGLPDVPTAGDVFRVVPDERTARDMAGEQADRARATMESAVRRPMSLEDVYAQMQAGKVKELRLIIKVDVDGSLEPIVNSLNQLSSDDLRVRILHTGTGEITESDLMLATASDAIVIGFHVQLSPTIQKSDLAQQVEVRTYSVIYELIADVDKALKGLLEPVYVDKQVGRAEVRAVFKIPRRGNIAGCMVQEGQINRNALARVRRNDKIIAEGKIHSLKRFTEDVTEVKTGFECGIGLENFDDFQNGDTIETYQKVREARV